MWVICTPEYINYFPKGPEKGYQHAVRGVDLLRGSLTLLDIVDLFANCGIRTSSEFGEG